MTGYHPAAAWMAYLVLGLAVGRLDLARQRSQVGIACAGAGAVVLSAVASAVLLGPAGGQQELEAASGDSVVVDRGFFGTVPTVSRW